MLTFSYIKIQKTKGLANFAEYIKEKMRGKSQKNPVTRWKTRKSTIYNQI